jgi:hypothetical protein
MRIIVCGGRDFDDPLTVRRTLFAIHEGPRGPIKHLWHGNARGADTLADGWASEVGVPCHPTPAQWSKFGKKAGPMRNQAMLGQGIDLVVAFPGGRGTDDMKKRARAAGVEVLEITDKIAV